MYGTPCRKTAKLTTIVEETAANKQMNTEDNVMEHVYLASLLACASCIIGGFITAAGMICMAAVMGGGRE